LYAQYEASCCRCRKPATCCAAPGRLLRRRLRGALRSCAAGWLPCALALRRCAGLGVGPEGGRGTGVNQEDEVHSLAKKTEKFDDTMSEVLGQIGQIATAVAALSQMDKEVEKVWILTIMAQSISELQDSDYEKVWNKYGASEPAQAV
jgi:hypothetical protein